MIPARWRNVALVSSILLLCVVLLAACGNGPSQAQARPTPSPTPPGQGKQLLAAMAHLLSTAKTLHGVFDLTISGRALNGNATTEVWNMSPNKSRTVVLQSTVSQIEKGSITVTDGKQLWQYDPLNNVVYNGPVSTTNGTATGGNQSQFVLNLVQNIFTHSDGTVKSSTTVDNHAVYDVHIVPQQDSANGTGDISFNYAGEVYIDKNTQLPVKLDLDVVGFGNVLLNLPTFEVDQTLATSLFTFTPPPGAKVLPLRQATPTDTTGALTLVQAQQQAGYHLLSIPGDQADYVLQGVNALGAPGNQIYTLNYMKGNLAFTISEGKPLANLPDPSGQQVNLRNTIGTISSANGTATLAWTENNVGIHISGKLSNDQLVGIARLLS
ncbi:MAG TPA: hypothetical protein VFU49_06825 [Ktedonobacteraceae bacterium]|nr:hypothetical protein [Ktedonobacteraceae bacterium]